MKDVIKATAAIALASVGAGHYATEVPHAAAPGAILCKRDDDSETPVDGPDREMPGIVHEQAPPPVSMPFVQNNWMHWDEAAHSHNRTAAQIMETPRNDALLALLSSESASA